MLLAQPHARKLSVFVASCHPFILSSLLFANRDPDQIRFVT
jgi:hypothetical protein